MKKIKEKLIHWLGGYTLSDLPTERKFEIVTTSAPLVTLRAVSHAPTWTTLDEDDIKYIKKDLAYQLADDMVNNKMIVFDERQDGIYALVRATPIK